MDISQLSATTRVPPPPRRYIARDRLTDRLERGVYSHRLTVAAAPAGYGKTTALAGWARASRHPVAWVTADPRIGDAERFLRALFLAWEQVEPGILDTTPGVMLGGMAPDTDAVLAGLVALDRVANDHLAVVVDDAHLIADAGVHEALAFLIDHLPPWLHIVIGSRDLPPLPLARWRARQELLEILPEHLAFTPEETAAFLQLARGAELTPDAIAPLQRRLEGWPAGLQLVSLTLPERLPDPDALVVRGQHRFIADYLREEVLAPMPARTRRFLLQTSIADRLCGPLCDAITGGTDGQVMLETLERGNLFITPLDDTRGWYRYHPLFAEVLTEEAAREDPGAIPDLHARAAAWYLQHEMEDPAFEHALAAADLPLVFEVLNGYGLAKLITGQFHTMQAWLRALPGDWYAQEPELGLLRVAYNIFSGHFEPVPGMLDELEQMVTGAPVVNERALGRVTAVRCFIACEFNDLPQAERLGSAALELLPPSDDLFREGIFGALGDVYRRNSRWSEAWHNYQVALEHSDTPAGRVQAAGTLGALADLSLRRGRLHEAARYWQRALDRMSERRLWGGYRLPVIGWVHVRLGELLYEWNRLDEARAHLEIGDEQARLGGDPRTIIAGSLLGMRLHLAHGEHDAAADALEHARAVTDAAMFPEWRAEQERCQVALWLARGQLRSAVAWCDAARSREPGALPDQEPVTLAIARVLIATGDAGAIGQALGLVDGLAREAREQGRIGLETDALALRAMALWTRGDRADALAALERALRLAEPEGHIRLFVDLGMPMARLLQAATARKVLPDYVSRILGAFDPSGLSGLPEGARLPEPLSEREREVLGLLAAGLTNREIAEALYISAETVKKHTGNIYGKLGVRGRTAAVARAREADLLD